MPGARETPVAWTRDRSAGPANGVTGNQHRMPPPLKKATNAAWRSFARWWTRWNSTTPATNWYGANLRHEIALKNSPKGPFRGE